MQAEAEEAAKVILADSKHFKICNQNCPHIIRAALAAALIHIDQEPCKLQLAVRLENNRGLRFLKSGHSGVGFFLEL